MITVSIEQILRAAGEYDYFRVGMANTTKPTAVTEVLALCEHDTLVTTHGKQLSASAILYWIAGKHFGGETAAQGVNGCQAYSRCSVLALPPSRQRQLLLRALDESGDARVITWRSHPAILMTTSMPLVVAG